MVVYGNIGQYMALYGNIVNLEGVNADVSIFGLDVVEQKTASAVKRTCDEDTWSDKCRYGGCHSTNYPERSSYHSCWSL